MKQFENLAFEFFDTLIISKNDRSQITHIDHSKIKLFQMELIPTILKTLRSKKNLI